MLAIIIPYYKLIFFEATLQSLVNQTDQRFRVYIGDDASPEDCTFLLGKYKGQFYCHQFMANKQKHQRIDVKKQQKCQFIDVFVSL